MLVLVSGPVVLATAVFGFWRPSGIFRLAFLGAALIIFAAAAFAMTFAVFAALEPHGWNAQR